MSALNPQLSPIDNLLAQISLDNPADPTTQPPTPAFEATAAMVTVSVPTPITSQVGNTSIILSVVSGAAEGGPWQFTYTRLSIAQLIAGYTPAPLQYQLQLNELDGPQTTILNLNVTLANVVAQLLGVSSTLLASDFQWVMGTGQNLRPLNGYQTTVAIQVQANAITLRDPSPVTVVLNWPVRSTDKSMADLSVLSLTGFSLT